MKRLNKALLKKSIGVLLLFGVAILISTIFNEGVYRIDYLGNAILLTLPISFVAMIVPAIAWLTHHKHLSRKKGVKICTVNSLILLVITAFLPLKTVIENRPCQPSESMCSTLFSQKILILFLLLAIMYCFINICFWVDFDNKKNGLGDRT